MTSPDFNTEPNEAEKLSRLSAGEERRSFNTRHSTLVRWLRLILPMIAIAITAAVFTWIGLDEGQVVLEQTMPEEEKATRNELLNPHFESRDEKNQPYSITALKAVQDEQDEKLVHLENPAGEMILNSGDFLKISADSGRYHQENETLGLNDNVTLNYTPESGLYVISTAAVHINLKTSEAVSENPVQGNGPLGRIEAQGFRATMESGRLIFNGPAKLTINREAL